MSRLEISYLLWIFFPTPAYSTVYLCNTINKKSRIYRILLIYYYE